jgi:hypothetical protein
MTGSRASSTEASLFAGTFPETVGGKMLNCKLREKYAYACRDAEWTASPKTGTGTPNGSASRGLFTCCDGLGLAGGGCGAVAAYRSQPWLKRPGAQA